MCQKRRIYYRGPGLAFRSLSYIGQSARKIDAHWLSMQLHIRYLRSLEDSARVRIACLSFLQTSLIYFYPEYPAIIEQAQRLAKELGGQLGCAAVVLEVLLDEVAFRLACGKGWSRANAEIPGGLCRSSGTASLWVDEKAPFPGVTPNSADRHQAVGNESASAVVNSLRQRL